MWHTLATTLGRSVFSFFDLLLLIVVYSIATEGLYVVAVGLGISGITVSAFAALYNRACDEDALWIKWSKELNEEMDAELGRRKQREET